MDAHDLIFGIRRSIRYHNKRRMFFDRLNKINLFLSAISATAVVATVIGGAPKYVQVIFSGLVVIFSTLDLVVGSPQMARLHSDLYRLFVELEREMVLAGENLSDDQLSLFAAKRLEIEAKEPSVMTALNLLCHNELARAEGYGKEYMADVPQWKAWLSQFFSFDSLVTEKQK